MDHRAHTERLVQPIHQTSTFVLDEDSYELFAGRLPRLGVEVDLVEAPCAVAAATAHTR